MPVLPCYGEDAALGGLYVLHQPLPVHRAQRDDLVSLECARARACVLFFCLCQSLALPSSEFVCEREENAEKRGRSFDTRVLINHPPLRH